MVQNLRVMEWTNLRHRKPRSEWVGEAISSMLRPAYRNFEAIVVDDGSTDDTRLRVAQFRSDARVRYIYQENGGALGR